jgi:hypothetical protein
MLRPMPRPAPGARDQTDLPGKIEQGHEWTTFYQIVFIDIL